MEWRFLILKIKETIIVEGLSDVQFLQSFIAADFIYTNGSAINTETIKLIIKANEVNGVIIFTDPDFVGEKIRKTILEKVPTAKNAFIALNKNYFNSQKKFGVAECKKEIVLQALERVVTFKKTEELTFTIMDLVKLNLTGQPQSVNLRKKVASHFNIGWGSCKTFLKRLNMLSITVSEVQKLLEANDEHCL